jgi:hypothetical protein
MNLFWTLNYYNLSFSFQFSFVSYEKIRSILYSPLILRTHFKITYNFILRSLTSNFLLVHVNLRVRLRDTPILKIALL